MARTRKKTPQEKKAHRPGSKGVRQIYWPKCSVCQFMKNNPIFKYQVMNSKYFKPEGTKSLAEVIHEFGDPFKITTVYMHMMRHQENDLLTAKTRFRKAALQDPDNPASISVVEGEVVSRSAHELGLDEFIKEGRDKLMRREMTITASTYLQAIKIKSDIEKNTKDRRLEAIKAFFGGSGEAQGNQGN